MKIYVGIDLHKVSSTWVGLKEKGDEPLFVKEFPVTPSGVSEGITLVKEYSSDAEIALEPCLGWRWVMEQLQEAGMSVHITNPRRTKMISDSIQKTDRNDAKTLAILLRSGMFYESYITPPEIHTLRSLLRERSFLVCTRASFKCRLEGVVTREGRHLVSGSSSSQKATKSILAYDNPEWNTHLTIISELTNHILKLEKEIQEKAKDLTLPKLLQTMPGVGAITALNIYAEVGDFTRFDSPHKLTAYAGLVPSERSSGGVRRLGHISKAGSRQLRYIIVEAAMHVRNKDKGTHLYDFYASLKKTRGAMRSRVALARKMLTIMWYMVKENKPYEYKLQ
jgi:transposase